ncbi:MAG: hypothetical protein BTN85_1364 [Candidatus Methanohalarchaeum thermophilum]|uniref:Uncharacterized protein n=1 Tax=Methanohalarchaeum thermophilum TaxID=1903181 RepID=A0A1Q6DWY0_METT1|nr:MAG: hypothetical protein BTN85_1364 [Candidatus Methanohalarchaeum thermophilum]
MLVEHLQDTPMEWMQKANYFWLCHQELSLYLSMERIVLPVDRMHEKIPMQKSKFHLNKVCREAHAFRK